MKAKYISIKHKNVKQEQNIRHAEYVIVTLHIKSARGYSSPLCEGE